MHRHNNWMSRNVKFFSLFCVPSVSAHDRSISVSICVLSFSSIYIYMYVYFLPLFFSLSLVSLFLFKFPTEWRGIPDKWCEMSTQPGLKKRRGFKQKIVSSILALLEARYRGDGQGIYTGVGPCLGARLLSIWPPGCDNLHFTQRATFCFAPLCQCPCRSLIYR